MSETTTYSVITSGELLIGFDPLQVQAEFSSLFKITPQKAATLLQGRRVIKKEIDLKTAQLYKNKLQGIGVEVTLKPQTKTVETQLSLVPTDDEINDVNPSSANNPHNNEAGSSQLTCPKCHLQQALSNEQCAGCGVYMHKVLAQGSAQFKPANTTQATPSDDYDNIKAASYVDSEGLSTKSLAVGVVAALLGALIWNGIADAFGIELGLVAWLVGGMVGFAVALSGSRGETAGVVCGVLALLAILGGKYMIYSGFKDDFAQALAGSIDEVQTVYELEMIAAEAYDEVIGDESLRQFMLDYEYTEQNNVEAISQQEIESFKQTSASRLSDLNYDKPTFEQWYQSTIDENLDNLSTFELIEQDMGLLDFVFLIFGVATAYRLGRGAES